MILLTRKGWEDKIPWSVHQGAQVVGLDTGKSILDYVLNIPLDEEIELMRPPECLGSQLGRF